MKNSRLRFLIISIVLFCISSGCVNHGNLTFRDVPQPEEYQISGKIILSDPVESDLLGSMRQAMPDLITNPNFSKFILNASALSVGVATDATFMIQNVPFSNTLVLNAVAGKVALKKRLYPDELRETDLSRTTINIDSTAKAMIWEKGSLIGKDLTLADITAREYAPLVATLATAIKLSLQLPKSSVIATVLDTDMVQIPAKSAAQAIIPREKTLTEAFSVLQNIILRKDSNLFQHYISPDFGNDWDSTANYSDCLAAIQRYFKEYDFNTASYTIHQMEFLPDNKAIVRVSFQLEMIDISSGLPVTSPIYTTDVGWELEGTMWKIYRNLPYKPGDPTQLGADSRWGEISRAHASLQLALVREELATMSQYISENFGNDWDLNSTKNDLLETARVRFLNDDVKVATYSIKTIEFIGSDSAKIRCSGEVRVISHTLGIDLDWGAVNAVVQWRREVDGWKLFRNLPYKLNHPRNLN
ncbi:MAG: hypothetical protein HQM08_25360 [Candidatus Riflebacteria bacterium]|nr:hypothetical protein [Candidatus Riflebacteria bacterium]